MHGPPFGIDSHASAASSAVVTRIQPAAQSLWRIASSTRFAASRSTGRRSPQTRPLSRLLSSFKRRLAISVPRAASTSATGARRSKRTRLSRPRLERASTDSASIMRSCCSPITSTRSHVARGSREAFATNCRWAAQERCGARAAGRTCRRARAARRAGRTAQMAHARLAGEARVNHVDRVAKAPAAQVGLHLLDHRLVVGVLRPDPAAHGNPLPRGREADHDRRAVRAVVPGVTEAAQWPSILAGGALLLRLVPVCRGLLGGVTRPAGRGGVEEDHIDLEVQDGGHAEQHRLLHALYAAEEEVRRAVELIVADALDAVDHDVATRPARGLQLVRWLGAALTDHREDCPLDPRAPRACHARDRLADAELLPQAPHDVRAA